MKNSFKYFYENSVFQLSRHVRFNFISITKLLFKTEYKNFSGKNKVFKYLKTLIK